MAISSALQMDLETELQSDEESVLNDSGCKASFFRSRFVVRADSKVIIESRSRLRLGSLMFRGNASQKRKVSTQGSIIKFLRHRSFSRSSKPRPSKY